MNPTTQPIEKGEEKMNEALLPTVGPASDEAATAQSAAATIKVVVNRQYGGFGISEAALYAYTARKGITLYPEDGKFGDKTWWVVPPDQRPAILEGVAWHSATMEERQASNAAWEAATIYSRDIARDDADLIAVVEELGPTADGRHAKLEVVEIPADVKWRIEEYDGREWIAEEHRTW